MIGTTLNNRYTLNKRLGKGAMGTVYRASDAQTGQDVAVKIIARELAFDADMLERFRREGEALRQLRHPNIVGFVDAFQYDEQYAIVLEYVSGGNLHDLVKKGPLPAERAQRMALELCDALTRAHHLHIVHRDIKPENVLLDTDGTPKLTDFGVARLVSEGNRLTGTGTQIGTPYYMSPEAWEGKPLDAQSDVWSLGVVLYEMLSGEVPFGGETLVAVMNKVLTAPLPDLKTKRPEVPDGLAQIVRRMLTREKDARYRSMREAAADLERGGPASHASAPAAVSPVPTVPAFSPPTEKMAAVKTSAHGLAHSWPAILGIILSLLGAIAGPGLLSFATENYSKGPLWIIAALMLAAAVLLGVWGLSRERAQPSRWGRLEAGLSIGLGGLAGVAFLVAGFATGSARLFAGGDATAGTATLAPTAAPTSTPAPVYVTEGTPGEVLFEDDFESGASLNWELDPAWKAETADGRAVLRGAGSKDGNFAHLLGKNLSDHAAQFDFKFVKPSADGQPHIQVFARAGDCPRGTEWQASYTADLMPGSVVLMKGVCERPREWITLAEAPHDVDPDQWHNVQFSLIGNRVQVYLDGEPLIDYVDADAPILSGRFALVTNDGTEALFDNVRVTEIIPGLACAPGETELFADDFEDGNTADWTFHDENGIATGAWQVQSDGANSFLVGEGHNWALAGDENWTDYRLIVRVRLAANNSSVHFNIRKFAGESRYYLNYPGGGLSKDPSAMDLTQATFPQDDQWHLVTLSSAGGHLEIALDGERIASYDDPDPLRPGNIGLENLDGTMWYDDVLVCALPPESTPSTPTAAATPASPETVAAALADPWGAVVVPSGESILIGVVSDVSGGASQLGADQRDAVLLAIEDYGLLAGFAVAVDSQDDTCAPEGGQAAALELTGRDSLAAVVGTTCSSALSGAMPVFDAAHVVFISPSASGDNLSQQGSLLFNRLVLADALNPGGNSLADPASTAYQEFATRFKDKFGRDCCAPFAAEAYDAAMILLKSIESVAVVDENGRLIIPRKALAEAVRGVKDYGGLSGVITFDPNGDRLPPTTPTPSP